MIQWPFEIKEDKYSKWYEQLVTNAKDRTLSEEIYTESHHIIPASIGGSNDNKNKVTLTAREHYIAHALLWKMRMPLMQNNKMMMALHVMVNGSGTEKQKRNYRINSKIFAANRIKWAKYMSESRKGEGNHFYGKKHSAESIEKMIKIQNDPVRLKWQSDRVTGEKNPMYGKTHSKEMKDKISKSCAASWSIDDKEKKAVWAKEKWKDPEFRALHTARATCPHCGHVSNRTTITKWHGDKCKHKSANFNNLFKIQP